MSKILKTSPEGRKCMHRDCTKILSVYNHEAYCHAHLDEMLHKQKTKPLNAGPLIMEHEAVKDLIDPLTK